MLAGVKKQVLKPLTSSYPSGTDQVKMQSTTTRGCHMHTTWLPLRLECNAPICIHISKILYIRRSETIKKLSRGIKENATWRMI